MSVCLSVRYAFGHGTTKCNEIWQGIPFRPEEGRDEVGGAEGGVLGRIFQVFWKTIRKFLRFFKKFKDPEGGRDEVGGAEGGVLGRIFQVFWKTIRKCL